METYVPDCKFSEKIDFQTHENMIKKIFTQTYIFIDIVILLLDATLY